MDLVRTSGALGRAGVLALVAALGLAACGYGEERTQQRIADKSRADSVNATIGPLRLLAVRIETPVDTVHVEGGNVGLFLTVANTGSTTDTLIAASTVDAKQIIFRDGTSPAAAGISVEVPPGGVASMQYPAGPHLELVGLRRDIPAGRFMPVTFRFKQAGVLTINVFVQGYAHPLVAPLSTSPSATT